MKSLSEILEIGRKTIKIENEAIQKLCNQLDDDFGMLVHAILNCTGRVVVTGIGKSAIIAQKLVATLNSTGTPSVFLHAADAVHGDLGTIQKADIIICLSKSGNTPELKVLMPLLKQGGNKIAAIVGDTQSYLAVHSDFVLNTSVEKEACPNNLAPTTSTTAQLVMADALAVALIECRDFSDQDFAKFHPGGALGKRLYLKVYDLSNANEKPEVKPDANIREIIYEITKKRLGMVAVTQGGELLGVITDGDLRRMMEKHENFEKIYAREIMSSNPKTIEHNDMAVNALQLMKQYNITQLVVIKNNLYYGIVHLHDLLKEGII